MVNQSLTIDDACVPPSTSTLLHPLPSALTIETAEAIAMGFQNQQFEAATVVTLDAAHVENITTPGLQVLASLYKTVQAQQGKLVIQGLGPSLVSVFRDTGLAYLLG